VQQSHGDNQLSLGFATSLHRVLGCAPKRTPARAANTKWRPVIIIAQSVYVIPRVDTNSCYANAALIQDWNVLYTLIRFRFLSLNRHVRLNFRLPFRFSSALHSAHCHQVLLNSQHTAVWSEWGTVASSWSLILQISFESSLQNYKQ